MFSTPLTYRCPQLLTDEAYPTVASANVTAVDWDNSMESRTLTYHPDGDASASSSDIKWFEEQNGTLQPANGNAITSVVDAATAITYAGTAADTKDDLATYDLDHPNLTLTLHYTEDVAQSKAEGRQNRGSCRAGNRHPDSNANAGCNSDGCANRYRHTTHPPTTHTQPPRRPPSDLPLWSRPPQQSPLPPKLLPPRPPPSRRPLP